MIYTPFTSLKEVILTWIDSSNRNKDLILYEIYDVMDKSKNQDIYNLLLNLENRHVDFLYRTFLHEEIRYAEEMEQEDLFKNLVYVETEIRNFINYN